MYSELRFCLNILRSATPYAAAGSILGAVGGLASGFGIGQAMKAGGTFALAGYFVWLSVKGVKMIFYDDDGRHNGK